MVRVLDGFHHELAGAAISLPVVTAGGLILGYMLTGAVLVEVTFSLPGIGSDIPQPGVTEVAYPSTPIGGLLSLMTAVTDLEPRLPEIGCPLLLFSSRHDHVVAPTAADLLAARVSGPVERVICERSYHVATRDYDGAQIAARTVEFARKVTGVAQPPA